MRPQKLLFGVLSVAFFLSLLQGAAFLARERLRTDIFCNDAGPFGVEMDFPLLLFIFVLAAAFFLWQWWQADTRKMSVLWLLLLSAGGSNLIERVRYGCVFDYLHLPYLPLFNLADVVLTISVIFLLWQEIRLRSVSSS